MAPQKIDFLMTQNGQIEAVKVRVFDVCTGEPSAKFDGSPLNGWHGTASQLDELITILNSVRRSMGGAADARTD